MEHIANAIIIVLTPFSVLFGISLCIRAVSKLG
jgi:hypothetical protein